MHPFPRRRYQDATMQRAHEPALPCRSPPASRPIRGLNRREARVLLAAPAGRSGASPPPAAPAAAAWSSPRPDSCRGKGRRRDPRRSIRSRPSVGCAARGGPTARLRIQGASVTADADRNSTTESRLAMRAARATSMARIAAKWAPSTIRSPLAVPSFLINRGMSVNIAMELLRAEVAFPNTALQSMH